MKKQKNIIIAMVLAVALPTVGDTNEVFSDTGPMTDASYSTLKGAFENAEIAETEDVLGWVSGRCFYKDSSEEPEESLLAGLIAVNGDGSLQHKYTIVTYIFLSDPDYFDDATRVKNNKEIKPFIDKHLLPSMKKDGSLVVVANDVMGGSFTLRLRKEAGYLLLKVSRSGMLVASRSSLEVSASEFAVLYCYYFKKVRETHAQSK